MSRLLTHLIAWGIAVQLFGGLHLVAYAQAEAPDKSSSKVNVALELRSTDELLKRAEAAAARGDWPEARRNLAELFRRDPGFEVTASLADVELKLLDYLSAAEHARRALDSMPDGASPRTRRDLERILSAASTQLGMLEITTEPSAAGIVLDGERSHLSPLVTPGTHEVRAHLTGYDDATVRVVVLRKQVVQLTLRLSPRSTTAQLPGPGFNPDSAPDATHPAVSGGSGASVKRGSASAKPTSDAKAQRSVMAVAPAAAVPPAQPQVSPTGRDVLLAAGGGLAVLAAGFGATFIGWGNTGTERLGASSWLLGSAGLSLATSVSWQIWGLATTNSPEPVFRMFLAGSSPGRPSAAKLVTVSGLHAATLASLGIGIWKALQLQNDLQAEPRRSGLDQDRKLAVGLMAVSGVLHVLSEVALEWWPNSLEDAVASRGGD